MTWQVIEADCVEAMKKMEADSIDAIVTDPPAGISFMGRGWDSDRSGGFVAWLASVMEEALRVTKPGGHALVWALPRTSHWTGSAIEAAGWEIRDRITHHFGSGFPKSLDVSKAIDRRREDNPDWQRVGAWLRQQRETGGVSAKALCAAIGAHGEVNHGGAVSNWEKGFSCPTWDQWEAMRSALDFADDMDAEVWRLNGRKGQPGENWEKREKIREVDSGLHRGSGTTVAFGQGTDRSLVDVTAPATPEAQRWQGWGTALKPATEDWWLARKPLVGTVAQNVERFGTGALAIDRCRIGLDGERPPTGSGDRRGGDKYAQDEWTRTQMANGGNETPATGRWPANCVLSHAEGCVRVGERRVKSSPPIERNQAARPEQLSKGAEKARTGEIQGYADSDGLETVEAWSCAPGCPVAELDRQSGERPSAGRYLRPEEGNARQAHARSSWTLRDDTYDNNYANETGGASRFFATFSNQEERHEQSDRPPLDRDSLDDRESEGPPEGDSGVQEAATRGSGEDRLGKPGQHDANPQLGPRADSAMAGPLVPASLSPEPRSRYVAKASRAERNAGLEGFEERPAGSGDERPGGSMHERYGDDNGSGKTPLTRNSHPTVKPVDLMRWLVRLVCPPDGTVLDCFAGSGTTGIACVLEDFDFIGLEREAEYCAIARARIDYWAKQPKQLGLLDV